MKLRIEKAVYGGAGLARATEGEAAGKAVFVPLTLPGELVEAHIVDDRRGFANAELDAVLDPSPDRTAAPCRYFAACGGCHYQHAAYASQMQMKAAILRETLERARLEDLPEIDAIFAEPFGYRNRIRLLIERKPFGLAYRRMRSHEPLRVSGCPIAAPLLEKAIEAVTNAGEASGLAGLCDEIELFTDADQAGLLLSLTARQAHKADGELAKLGEGLRRTLPELRGVSLWSAADEKRHPQRLATWGEQSLTYRAAGRPYRVSAGSFFQVNRFLVDRLLERVTQDRSGTLAWDLYAGAGLFASALAAGFRQVVAVESAPSSFGDLKENLKDGQTAVRATTLEFLRREAAKPVVTAPDLIVVDPPRAGLGAEVTTLLGRIRPTQIVYVSCDPATLSRDLAALVKSNFHIESITLLDLFPQTFHLESITILSRR